MQQRPTISPHASQLPLNQHSMQLPMGLTSAGLSMQQGALPSIQPIIQPVANSGEIKRKAIHPTIMDASRSVMDKSNNVSKAAYGKASTMVNDVDKEKLKNMGKSMGKKMARYAGAVTGQIIREEIKQDTGITLPPLHITQRPNQQAQSLHAQMQIQQGKQEIEKLHAQLQLMQKMSQIQSQASLMQQQQHQTPVHPGVAGMPPTGNNNLSTQLPTTTHLTASIPSMQAPTTPVVHNLTPLTTLSGNTSALHAMTPASTPGIHSPSLSNIASAPPSEVYAIQGVHGLGPSGIAHVPTNEPSIAPSVHSSNPSGMAPIPPSELSTISHSASPYSSEMAPIPPSEWSAMPNNTSPYSSEMTPIPPSDAIYAHTGASATLNSSGIAPIPYSEADIAPIPPCEQTPPVHSTDENGHSSQVTPVHSSSPSPAPTQVVEAPSPHSSASNLAQGQNAHHSPQQQPHTSNPQGSANPHSQTAHDHYEHPPVENESENETLQPGPNPTVPENQHNSSHEGNGAHVQESNNLPATSQSVTEPSHPQTEHHSFNTPAEHHPVQHGYPGTNSNSSNFHDTATDQYHDTSNQHYSTDHQQVQSTQPGLSNTATPSQHPYINNQQPQSSTQPDPPNPYGPATSQYSNTNGQPNVQPIVQPSPPRPYNTTMPNEHPYPNTQQFPSHGQGAFEPQHQSGQLPTGSSFPTGGQAGEYYQTHPMNASGTGNSTAGWNHQSQPNSTYNPTNPQSSPPPFQPQSPITATTMPTINPSSTQSPPPQNSIPLGGNTQGIPQGSLPGYVQAQTQQLHMANDQLNVQNQQINALQQHIQAMNVQQQQQAQQAQLQLLSNQLQQQQQNQQGSGGSQLVDAGLSILNNLTQNLGNNNGPSLSIGLNNNSLQQLQLQEQQQELLSLNYLNDLQLQNQVNAENMIAMNDQMQANMQMDELNAQLAALNTAQSSSFNYGAMGMGDVNVNMDIVVDQSFDIQSNTGGFDVTDTSSVFVADSSTVEFC
jgi:hypothetical protein